MAVLFAALAVVSFLAGAINSVAGGGTLLTFPTLLVLGVSPVAANATNTVGLVPASLSAFWSYRGRMSGTRAQLWLLGVPSSAGGVIGAIVVVRVGNSVFSHLVPWLIFLATALFIVQKPISRVMARRRAQNADNSAVPKSKLAHLIAIALFQLFVAIYGGYFGAGIGILMLASLGLMGYATDINRANGIKNFCAALINGVASVTFAIERQVHWFLAGWMVVFSIAGGSLGAQGAQKLGQATVRKLIIGIGVSIGVFMLITQH
jgi:uncharacterized membrane protein YfcA